MLRMQMVGLVVVGALVMSAVAAGSASAAHEWLINGTAITSRIVVHGSGLALLADTKAPGGEIKIHCHAFGDGYVGPGGIGLALAVTAELLGTNNRISCTFDKAGACKSNAPVLALAIHLPVLTLLVLSGGEVRGLAESDGNGTPGAKFTCTNILGSETVDECTAEQGSAALKNVAAGVEVIADALSPKANCTLGGTGAGVASGSGLIESPSATEKLTFD
jgi:hypothetical protein